MIEIRQLSLQRGDKLLLNHANATILPKQRVGLIGKNGSGKSSLFALIQNSISPDSGSLLIPVHWQIAAVAQETPALNISALDYTLQGDHTLQTLQQALQAAEAANNGDQIAHIHAQLEEIDAYTAPARAAKLLSGLGFSEAAQDQAVATFSGGWRMRLNLAQALIQPSDLLLLDEPTNHLDLETVLWLEQYLASLGNTQIIISHDRDFLNATTTHTIELHGQSLQSYSGNYDAYQKERAQRLSQQQAAYSKQQAHIQHLQSFINRFKAKATKATQAQSRIKALEKLERIAPAHLDSEFSFQFQAPSHLPNPLLQFNQVSLGYGDVPILQGLNLSLESGARIGLLGVNGSGKSTLIKAIAGEIAPQSGSITRAEKLHIGYFAQHQLDTLRPDQSPLWHIRQKSPEAKEQDIRNFLGSFHFHGDIVHQAIAPFSGGEKARLALALIVWEAPNLLLLDEPTNHLDLDMRHALSLALQSYEGALIVVSHDRSLLETTTDSYQLIAQHTLQPFDGSLDDYRQYRLQEVSQQRQASKPQSAEPSRKDTKRLEAQIRQEKARHTKPIQQKIAQAEQTLQQLEAEKAEYEAFLAQEEAYKEHNRAKLQENLANLTRVKVQLAETEENWLNWQDEMEQIIQNIQQHYTQLNE